LNTLNCVSSRKVVSLPTNCSTHQVQQNRKPAVVESVVCVRVCGTKHENLQAATASKVKTLWRDRNVCIVIIIIIVIINNKDFVDHIH